MLCLSLLTFLLVGLELPVSLLAPIARDLRITYGQAGLAITVSGFFAVATSLFGNGLLSRVDRKSVVLFYTGILSVSNVIVATAPNFTTFLIGRALVGVAIGGLLVAVNRYAGASGIFLGTAKGDRRPPT